MNRAHPGPTVRPPKSEEAYRGYLIRMNALTNTMWIEQNGVLVHHVPADKSWAYARSAIDSLVGPLAMSILATGPL
jgi:hypothetical protein